MPGYGFFPGLKRISELVAGNGRFYLTVYRLRDCLSVRLIGSVTSASNALRNGLPSSTCARLDPSRPHSPVRSDRISVLARRLLRCLCLSLTIETGIRLVAAPARPAILFILSDNHAWPAISACGDGRDLKLVAMPGFYAQEKDAWNAFFS